MEQELSRLQKKKHLHNLRFKRSKVLVRCKKREDRFLSVAKFTRFSFAFTLIVLLMPFILLKEIDSYLEESMMAIRKA